MPTCPYCGGSVAQQAGEVVLTCPYCGTAFVVGGSEIGEHLMGRVNYTIQEVLEVFKSWALRMPEAPNDLIGAARFRSYQLVFYPYWVYEVTGRFVVDGSVEEESVELSIPAHRSMYGTPLEKARLSLSGKVYYSHRHVTLNNGKLVNPDVGPEEADRTALSLGRQAIAGKLSRRLGSRIRVGQLGFRITARRLIHVPVYTCTYDYGGREYQFMADASDARVLYAEVPIEFKFRVAALASGIASSLAALASLTFIGVAPVFALTSAVGASFVGAYSLYKGLRPRVEAKRFFHKRVNL